MNINIFFSAVFMGLLLIFVAFKPLKIKERKFGDVPVFELKKFQIYKFTPQGLTSVMAGSKAVRYHDRYDVFDINYTDNTKQIIANMKADRGLYKNDIIHLSGNVVYKRADGLIFETQKANYNQKTKTAYSDTKYIAYMGQNVVRGDSIRYNSVSQKIQSKNIVANYNIEEEGR